MRVGVALLLIGAGEIAQMLSRPCRRGSAPIVLLLPTESVTRASTGTPELVRDPRCMGTICMYFLYSVLSAAGMFLLAPYFLAKCLFVKGLRQRYLRNLPERFGLRFPSSLGAAPHDAGGGAFKRAQGAIWLHAVSVGEVLAAVPLARSLAKNHPEKRLVISTTTLTGQELAHQRMNFADTILYFPMDWRWAIRRTFRAVRPDLVIVCETEIWPNFLHEARRLGVPVIFVNGRISNRSFLRFSRALRFSAGLLRGFLRRVLNDATLYLMQSEQDRLRVVALGAETKHVFVTGNVKYDVALPGPSALCGWLAAEVARSGRSPVLVAGSVIAGEESAVLEALDIVTQRWPGALLVMAPRKPERFDAAAAIIESTRRHAVRRSDLSLDGRPSDASVTCRPGPLSIVPGALGSVLLLDTIGELAGLYALADAVFIGGSIEPAGGHNPLEPAAFGKVPVFGSWMDNFRDIAGALLAADAAIQVSSGAELGAAWTALLADDVRRERMGQAARELIDRHRGATAATLDHISALLTGARVRS